MSSRPIPITGPVEGQNVVQCSHCGLEWDRTDLYKTGDVLRCPSCDGVMEP